MKGWLAGGLVIVAGLAFIFSPWGRKTTPVTASGEIIEVSMPAAFDGPAETGRQAYADAECAACHGPNAGGIGGKGPPLVHRIYDSEHHTDAELATSSVEGIRAHHWPFGAMPPTEGLTQAEAETIVAFLRAVQRANGID
ncbi:c-type cytochrome [Maritimibacter fusiformis]|nr:cytochrome c [Maritimibacter fusiformis]